MWDFRKTKSNELAGKPTLTRLGAWKNKSVRVIGAGRKLKLLDANKVNVYDPKTKKHSTEEIQAVLENAANRQYVRRSILTKGVIVQTPKGKARITSSPGQDGVLNAILVE